MSTLTLTKERIRTLGPITLNQQTQGCQQSQGCQEVALTLDRAPRALEERGALRSPSPA